MQWISNLHIDLGTKILKFDKYLRLYTTAFSFLSLPCITLDINCTNFYTKLVFLVLQITQQSENSHMMMDN